MYPTFLKRWRSLGISISVALFVILLTQTLLQASARGKEPSRLERGKPATKTQILNNQAQLNSGILMARREAASTMMTGGTSLTLQLSNTFTTGIVTGNQRMVDVAFNSTDNEYLAVWEDDRNGNEDIYGQLLESNGYPIDGNFSLVTGTPTQTDPHIAFSPDGSRYLLVWAHKSGGDWNVYGRLLDTDGDPVGDTIVIDGSSTDDSQHPDVVYDADSGHFLVVWSRGNGHASILARKVETDADLGTTFTVASTTGNGPNKDAPAVAADGSGNFLVTWQEDEGSNADIKGQRVSMNATIGSAITIDNDSDNQDEPAVAYHATKDQYLVLWTDLNGSARRIMARFVDGDGSLPGSAFVFDSPSGIYDFQPEVLAMDDGFLVAYHWESTTFDVRVGTVNLAGIVDNIQYLSQSSNHQLRVALAGKGTTALALWETNEFAGSGYDIVGRGMLVWGSP